MNRETNERLRELDEQMRQQHLFIFETLKHFTTLDAASALLVVGLYRYLELEAGMVIGALAGFGLSLAVCAWGMLSIALGG